MFLWESILNIVHGNHTKSKNKCRYVSFCSSKKNLYKTYISLIFENYNFFCFFFVFEFCSISHCRWKLYDGFFCIIRNVRNMCQFSINSGISCFLCRIENKCFWGWNSSEKFSRKYQIIEDGMGTFSRSFSGFN